MVENEKQGLIRLDIDDDAGGILAYAIDDGEILDTDADWIWARFDAAKSEGNKLRIFAEMHALPHFHAGLVMEKLKRFGTLLTTIDRIAVVGDQGWLDVYAKIANPITPFDIRHFTLEDRQAAIDWVRS
ncbi:MAG: STAS/SEC14 domain-containing protein [Stappiaceae bacterium]